MPVYPGARRVVANLPYPNWNYFLIGGRAGRHPEALSRIS
jgi:hypothetical protein